MSIEQKSSRRIAIIAAFFAACLACIGTTESTFAEPLTPVGDAAGDRGTDPEIIFPDTMLAQNGGPIIDVRHPPDSSMHAAMGDGTTDDTDALKDAYDFIKKEFVAHGPWDRTNYYIYLPNGTYKVRDTIIYRGEDVGTPHKWTGKFDLDNVRFIGQSRAHTMIKLADHCDGFQDPTSPKPVLAYQHLDTVFNNAPGGNYLRSITIDTGSGNPGAVGLYMQGANQTDLQHVTIQSGDGAGVSGIWFKVGSLQGYYSDITVNGFDRGIDCPFNGEIDPTFEYLTLKGQKIAGIEHDGGAMSLRKVLSDQSDPNVQAIRIDKGGSLTVIIDSELRNKSSDKAAIELTSDEGQALVARNVTTSGYATGVIKHTATVAQAGTIEEYISSPVKTLATDSPAHTLNLPIEDSPIPPVIAPSDWAIVDDVSQLEEALTSGKAEIVLRKHTFALTKDLEVPASVKVIDAWGARITKKALIVSEASADPLFLLDGGLHTIVKAQRNVVANCTGGNLVNANDLPLTFYVNNVNDIASGNHFCPAGAKVFARSIDIEYANTEQIVCNGGTMWILGYKTENGKSSPFVCRNGGSLEILGGYTNATAMPKDPDKLKPVITNDNSNVSASFQINLRDWPKVILEKRGDNTLEATSSDFPKRGDSKNNYTVPLYAGFSMNRK